MKVMLIKDEAYSASNWKLELIHSNLKGYHDLWSSLSLITRNHKNYF